ncbi:uncharacterized protein N7503_002913 [Penicillium pulvis]|uniref:uncharacterized protein n=1 Tax=Penicillium pulvis TaxID=1562058 RepID=UPI0025471C6F|nr:uncharacterized protein N7503_002913 [Penicillium pulvis]KAJ5810695.1 hypothetical protein N7503_002913 [Penicillium pulvis]
MNFARPFYAPSVGAVSWTISAETSSIKLRAQTQSLAVTNALALLVVPEFKDRTFSELDGMFAQKIPTGQFTK